MNRRMMVARAKTLRSIWNELWGFINCPMKTHYSIPVLLLIVLWVLNHHDKGKDNRFHFVEMSEREGSFSLLDWSSRWKEDVWKIVERHWQQIRDVCCGEWSGGRTGTQVPIHWIGSHVRPHRQKETLLWVSMIGVTSSLNASWHSQCHRHLL